MRSVMLAPGMHPATASRFCRSFQAVSAEAGNANVFSSCTFMSPTTPPAAQAPLLGQEGRDASRLRTSSLVDSQGIAMLPDPVRAVRHVHVADPQVGECVDYRLAETRNATDVRRFGHAFSAD